MNLASLIQWLKNHKLHFLATLISIPIFLFIFFPYDDLSDWITSNVAQMSKNTVFIQFEKLNLNFFPTLGVEMNSVHLETTSTPSVSAENIIISPSISGLILQRPYGTVKIHGFLDGDASINVGKGSRTEKGLERHALELTFKKINLQKTKELFQAPFQINGKLHAEGLFLSDLDIQEPPEADLKVSVDELHIPPANINTPIGPLTLPEIKLSKVELQGRLSAGKFYIEKVTIGNSQDEINGEIKGNMDINLRSRPTPNISLGGYTLDLNLNMKKSFQDKASSFLIFIDNYKNNTTAGVSYKFRISAPNTLLIPQLSVIR